MNLHTPCPARTLLLMLVLSIALLPEPLLANLFAGNNANEREIYRINPDTAQGFIVTEFMDDLDLDALAADPARNTLYGLDAGDNSLLFSINTLSGEVTPIGTHVYDSRREGLAYDTNRNQLYMSGNMNGGELLRVDPATGQISVIGSFGTDSGVMWGLAYDPDSDTIYGTDLEKGGTTLLYRIDPETAVATLISVISDANQSILMDGLAFDSDRNTLYAIDNSADRLYSIDPATGDFTVVGAPGFNDGYRALTFLDDSPASVPVNHPVALMMLCLLLGLLAYRKI